MEEHVERRADAGEGLSSDATVLTRQLEEAVRRIVEAVHPLRIVLFGSAARQTATAASDIDLLVVVPDGVDRSEAAYQMHRSLRGLGRAKDIVVVSESEMRASRGNPYLIVHTALTEGRELYHAA